MTSSQAAGVLGVGSREVQRLGQVGALTVLGTAGRTTLFDPASVHRYSQQAKAAGRPWTATTAWAAVDLLTGGNAGWLDARRRRRLRARLARLDAAGLIWLARRRSTRAEFDAPDSRLGELRAAVIATSTSDEEERLDVDFELLPNNRKVHGYIAADLLTDLTGRFGLYPFVAGNVVLQVVGVAPDVTVRASSVLTALDLAGSADPREQSAGRRYLEHALTEFTP